MRKIFKSFMLVAAAAMAFASCQKEEKVAPETISATLTMHADIEATKTYLGEDNTVFWGTDEAVTLYVGSGETAKFFDSASTDANNGEASASFTFAMEGVTEADSYALGGIYPASAAMDDNKNATQYKVILPATQNQVDGNYDPSAYIMVLKPEVVTELPAEYTASFRRAVALNKITLTGVKEDISSVEITVPEKKYLAGRRYMDLTTGESGEVYYDQSNKVTVNSSFTGNSIDVWFTSWGVELAEGDELSIKMTSATKTYTRTIAARAEGIKFVEGDLNTLTVSMSSATEETLDNFSGEYLIVNTDLTRAAQAWANGNNLPEFVITTNEGVILESDGIANCKMIITKEADGYTIQDVSGKYLYAAGGTESNHLKGKTEKSYWTIEKGETNYVITSLAQNTRNILRYNSSSKIFSCYSSGQADVTLYKYSEIMPDTNPSVSVAETTSPSIGAEGGDLTFTCTIKNLDGETLEVVEDSDYLTWAVAENVVTITVVANEAAESRTLNATIKCGSVEVPVTINQAGKPEEGTPTTVTDKLVASLFAATNTTYANFSGVSVTSTAVYAGNSAKTSIGGIQLRSNNSNSGIVTTTSGGKAKTITVTWASGNTSGRTLDIYGKSTAYSAASDLYKSTNQGTKLGSIKEGTSTKLEITGDYEFIGLRSNSGAMYLTSIEITWETNGGSGSGETPEPELQERNLAFSSTAATATVGEDFTEPTLYGATAGVTYSSSNTSVATVNETTGAVTLVAAGETTITATAEADATYKAGEASYTLTVSAAQGGGDVSSSVLAYTFDVSSFGTTGYGVHKNIAKNNNMTWTMTCGQGGYLGINKAANASKLVLGDYLKVGTPIGYNASTLATAVISDTEMLNVGKVEFVGNSVTAVSGTTPTQISLVFSQDGNTYSLIETQAFNKTNGNTFEFAPKSSGYYAVVISGTAWFRLTGTQIKYYTN